MATNILVTHFINPHLFWYFRNDVPHYQVIKAELERLENEILEQCSNRKRSWKKSKTSVGPEVGECIVVYFKPWERFIRARVEKVCEFRSNPSEYIVWAMDYGFPFQTKIEYIYVLPKQCLTPIDKIKRGGIAYLLPAEKQLFGIELKTLRSLNWQQSACDSLEHLLFQSRTVVFDEKFCTNGDHYWGELKIETAPGCLQRADQYLLNHNYAIEIRNNFDILCLNLRTIDISPWFNNSGHSKCEHNKFSSLNQKHSMLWKNHHDFHQDDNMEADYYRKVEEWRERYQSTILQRGFDQIEPEPESKPAPELEVMEYLGSSVLSKNMIAERTTFNKFLKEKEEMRRDIEEIESIIFGKVYKLSEDAILAINTSLNFERFEVKQNKFTECSFSNYSASFEKTSSLNSSVSLPAENENFGTPVPGKISFQADRLLQVKNMKPSQQKNKEVQNIPEKYDGENVERRDDHLHKMLGEAKNNGNNEQKNNDEKQKTNTSTLNTGVSQPAQIEIFNNSVPGKMSSRADRLLQLKNIVQSMRSSQQKDEEVQIIPEKYGENVERKDDHLHKRLGEAKTTHGNIKQKVFTKEQNSTRTFTTHFKILPAGFEEHANDVVETDIRKLVRIKTFEEKMFLKNIASGSSCIDSSKYAYIPTTKESFKEYKPSDSSDDELHSLENNDKISTRNFFDWINSSKDSGAKGDDECDDINDKEHAELLKHFCKEKQIWNKMKNNKNRPKNKTIYTTEIKEIIPTDKLRYVPEERILQTSIIDDLVLAHSRENLRTIKQIEDLRLHSKIFQKVIDEKIVKIYRMQGYAWAHINLQHSIFLISGSKTGKTLSYIPQICDNVFKFIQNERFKVVCKSKNTENENNNSSSISSSSSSIKNSNNNKIQTHNGPVAIIIVPSAQHVHSVSFCCRQLLLNVRDEFRGKTAVVSCYGMSNLTNVKIELLNGCGILIVTPSSLCRLMDDTDNAPKLINYDKLRHIVIDDMDLIISRSEQVFIKVLKVLIKKFKNNNNQCDKTSLSSSLSTPQWIVTSRHWDKNMPHILKIVPQPVLLFGDFFEAAVYGHVSLRIKLCTQEQKMEVVRDALMQHSLHGERSLIFCNTKNDVHNVVQGLTAAGHKCFVYDDERSHKCDLRILLDWDKSILPGVVVCMDNAYCETNIQNVHNLIHFSMPNSWTKFTKRFRCISKNLENRVLNNFAKKSQNNSKNINAEETCVTRSLILLDEENSEQLPRLLNFMNTHKQNKIIQADIEAACRRVMQEREEKRILNGLPLCTFLLEFGDCDLPVCNERHILTRYDAIRPSEEIPPTGELKIHILRVNSPTHVTARLLAHKATGETTWRNIRASKDATKFGMTLNMHYSQKEHMLLFWPLELRKMCIYRSNHGCHRAMVLKMPKLTYPEVVQNVYVTVQLIDKGIELSNVESHDLFTCLPEFEDFPAQAVNIRLLNIVPYDNERTWDKNSTDMVQKWLIEELTNKEYVHVNISHTLANTIWVKNIIVMEHLSTVNQYVYRCNLKKNLLQKNFAVELENDKGISNLIEKFKLNNNLHDIETSPEKDKQQREVMTEKTEEKKEEEQQQNEMNKDTDQHESKIIDEVFTHLHDIETSPEKEKQQREVMTEKTEEKKEEEQQQNEINKNTDQHKSKVVDEVFTNSQKVIMKVGETVVQIARNSDSEKWSELPLHDLVAVELDETNNGHWNDIFLQIYNNMKDYHELSQLINEHVMNLKEDSQNEAIAKKHFDLTWFKSKPNCIIRFKEDGYFRAKVFGVHGEKTSKIIVRLFLCDYACFISRAVDNLFDDFFYETTDAIVNFMPYLAVHCRLTGLELNDLAGVERHKVHKKYLHAYAVRECKDVPKWLQPLNINSYEILLYESDGDMLNEFSEMLNKALIDNGVAVTKAETSHFLELDLCLSKVNYNENNAEDVNDKLMKNGEKEEDEEDASVMMAFLEEMKKMGLIKKIDNVNVIKSKNDTSKVKAIEKEEKQQQQQQKAVNDNDENHKSLKLNKPYVYGDMPGLNACYKRPRTTWYETEFLIHMNIYAPDVKNYYLEITENSLSFAAEIEGEEQMLLLHFLGTIQPEFAQHEVRGLKVVVRLVKSIFVKWPRLLQQNDKHSWLTYDLDKVKERDPLSYEQHNIFRAITGYDEKEENIGNYDENSDSDMEMLQNFTPITNKEDQYDPTHDF